MENRIGILWDLDGTLLNTLGDLTASVNFALAACGLPARTEAEVRGFIGNGVAALMERAVGDVSRPEALDVFRAHYEAHCREKTAPYPGIPEALADLGAEFPMAIVSNKVDSAAKNLCAAFFPGVLAIGETPDCPRKPAPEMVFRAMRELGVRRAVYVGDSDVDLATAANAQLPCLSVTWGFCDRARLAGCGAVYFCCDPAELPAQLRRIAARMED